jgi:hypothetical protein
MCWRGTSGIASTRRRLGCFQGRTSDPAPAKVLSIRHMLDEVKREAGKNGSEATGQAEKEAAAFLESVYAELSDGAHPTMWSLAGHFEIREDRTGVRWHRRADPSLRGGPMFDLDMCLKLVVGAIRRLVETADQVKEAFRKGPGSEEKHRHAVAKVVEAVLANPPELPDKAGTLLQQRGSALLEYWRSTSRPE